MACSSEYGHLFVAILLIGYVAETYTLQCYTCHGASSDVECNQNIELCTADKQACSTQVWGGRVTKLCMARDDCLLRHQEECADNGECAQCCTSDLCNRKTNTRISEHNNGLTNTTVKASACSSIPCQNGGQCTDFCGCASCECVPGFTGEYCENSYDVCEPSFCLNGGTEIVTCLCPPGTTGQYCETSLCFPACENGGICVGSVGVCWCPPEYTGASCETPNPCNPDPCVNGICIEDQCVCPPDFTGPLCETPNPCYPDPCVNGICYEGLCLCPPDYTGTLCETPNPCYPDQCVNGICYGDGLCICEPGYTGSFCESIIDPCWPNNCENGGECSGGVCLCPPIYTGPTCGECLCQNGFCMEDGTCLCLPSFVGELCEEYIPIGEGYNCTSQNPCTDLTMAFDMLFWPTANCSEYIHCVAGPPHQCYEKPCPPGLFWDICSNSCNAPLNICDPGLTRCDLKKWKRRAGGKRAVSPKS